MHCQTKIYESPSRRLPRICHTNVPDVDLLLVIERWRDLPDAMRAGIVAMVMTSGARTTLSFVFLRSDEPSDVPTVVESRGGDPGLVRRYPAFACSTRD